MAGLLATTQVRATVPLILDIKYWNSGSLMGVSVGKLPCPPAPPLPSLLDMTALVISITWLDQTSGWPLWKTEFRTWWTIVQSSSLPPISEVYLAILLNNHWKTLSFVELSQSLFFQPEKLLSDTTYCGSKFYKPTTQLPLLGLAALPWPYCQSLSLGNFVNGFVAIRNSLVSAWPAVLMFRDY